MFRLILISLLIFISHFLISPSYGQEQIDCENRYLTLINPVRSRELWFDKSLKPLHDQYKFIKTHNFSGTWLIQYDVLSDKELVTEIKKFNSQQEVGVFLEVSKEYANKARVIYPYDVPWFSPNAVFLSAYSPSERIRLIDKLFGDFKAEFGIYPKSVGAWWIDSNSLQYMKDKYRITSAMIVADQKTTDNYGVWGQWWGVPYYPSKNNVLVPASSISNKLDLVVVQWAQRDLTKAYGEGYLYSNYSLQANDYIRLGENTNHFNKLVDTYLDCRNKIGQITVGLETGIESVGYIDEYAKQLEELKKRDYLKSVTLFEFAKNFKEVHPNIIDRVYLGKGKDEWILNTSYRSNVFLKDRIDYYPDIVFADHFIADKNDFLDRKLPIGKQKSDYFPYWIFIFILGGLWAFIQKVFSKWIYYLIFVGGALGLFWKSYESLGWKVYFGPILDPIYLYQLGLALLTLVTFILLLRLKKLSGFIKCLPLTLGLIFILTQLRYTQISGVYYFGFGIDDLRFLGLGFKQTLNFQFINADLPAYQAAALIRFDHNKIWENPLLGFVFLPIVQIIIALVFYKFSSKFPQKLIQVITIILIVLTIFYFINIFSLDPRKVT